MNKVLNYFKITICLTVVFLTAPVVAVEEGTDLWASHLIVVKKLNLAFSILKEKMTLVNQGIPQAKNFGYNFPGVLPPLESALTETHKLFKSHKEPPLILDAPSGWGYASWKFLVAGGRVVPMELQKELEPKIKENLMRAENYLPNEKSLKDLETFKGLVPLISMENVLNFERPAYDYRYDGTYSGNLIHFLTPDETELYTKKLYEVTKPGGFAVASVVGPCAEDVIVDFWEKQRKQEVKSPGYMTHEIDEFNDDEYVGAYKVGSTKPHFGKRYVTVHSMDPETLAKFYSNAGFEVKESYWYDADYSEESKKYKFDELSLSQLKEQRLRYSGILAFKPQSNTSSKGEQN
ncbi:Putative methyltransferase [Candidatus Bealeia paramacronuclearis]|uniref:Methyltransferase n=1 Tax=Candidatus Bealeia paramacronuclearis TaxID=1921001 RepID=A0ABZ2C6D6_9PROT|nr:putative methyltransferase [Candidatus Bealeia paramacronuclearis]